MIDQDHIRRTIPLREPALHLDAVSVLERGRIVGSKAVSVAETCYPSNDAQLGHAYPFALLLESYVQACVMLTMSIEQDAELVPAIGRLAHAKERRRVFPGDVVVHEAHVVARSGNSFLLRGGSTVGERPVLTVERTLISLTQSSLYT